MSNWLIIIRVCLHGWELPTVTLPAKGASHVDRCSLFVDETWIVPRAKTIIRPQFSTTTSDHRKLAA